MQFSAKEVDATVERVLNDAEQRSQLLQMEGFTAGYTKGRFTLQDAAGNWVMRPRFEFDWRSMSSWRDEGKHGGNDTDSESGYQIGRMAFGAGRRDLQSELHLLLFIAGIPTSTVRDSQS